MSGGERDDSTPWRDWTPAQLAELEEAWRRRQLSKVASMLNEKTQLVGDSAELRELGFEFTAWGFRDELARVRDTNKLLESALKAVRDVCSKWIGVAAYVPLNMVEDVAAQAIDAAIKAAGADDVATLRGAVRMGLVPTVETLKLMVESTRAVATAPTQDLPPDDPGP